MSVDTNLLRDLYQSLEDKPLEPGDPYYEDVYSQQPDGESPINELAQSILWGGQEGIHLFSGFRGSGKTTELKRMKQQLEGEDFVVLMADALEYINPAGSIEISDLLIAMAGAFNDQLETHLNVKLAHEGYWTRLVNFLNTRVEFKEINLKAEAGTDGLKGGAELKAELKASPSFRRLVQDRLKNHLSALKAETDLFFEDGVRRLEAAGKGRKIVFIVDSLEQIRGSLSDEKDVLTSVQTLFSSHFEMLKIPWIHMVYTVPPWLKFRIKKISTTGLLYMIPSVKQWNNDASRTPYDDGTTALREMLKKRFKTTGFTALFGSTNALVDQLVLSCGGHFRDLLLLCRQVILRARRLPNLPVTQEVIDYALNEVRREYLPISGDDAEWLQRIATTHDPSLENTDSDADRLARFLDSHTVLYLKNGEDWYDVHPIIRDDVTRIAARAAPPVATNPPS
jgi:hypothetical protein